MFTQHVCRFLGKRNKGREVNRIFDAYFEYYSKVAVRRDTVSGNYRTDSFVDGDKVVPVPGEQWDRKSAAKEFRLLRRQGKEEEADKFLNYFRRGIPSSAVH